MTTKIDEALKLAKKNPALGHVFYDAFLNSAILLPVLAESSEKGSWRALDPKERFFPLFIKENDKKVVPVFDELVRLKNWSISSPLDYVTLAGYRLLNILDPSIGIMLNLGTDYSYYFSEELLKKLRENLKAVRPEEFH